jgi:outer membrane protein insertion porin family
MRGPTGITGRRSLRYAWDGWTIRPAGLRSALKAAGLAGLLALAAWFAPASDAQTVSGRVNVADVIIQGSKNITNDRIMGFIKIRAGNTYTREALSNALMEDTRKLLDTNMFKDVRPQTYELADGRVNVVFTVLEYPNLIQEIIYKNANHLSQKDLEEMTHLRKGAPLDTRLVNQARWEIEDSLRKKGRYFAHVTILEGTKPEDRRVVFNITEGPVVRVRNTSFVGNKTLASTDRLRTQIDTSRAFLQILGGKINLAMIDGDVLKIEEYYKDNGYLDVRVTRELIFTPDFLFADVVFHISEGQRYRVQGVNLEGPKILPREQVASIIRLKQGDYYNEGLVKADLRNITDFYGWRGYQVKAEREPIYGQEPGLVRVHYKVDEKPEAKVGQIIIIGNDVTQDRIIRRVIGLYPGQTLHYPELRIAEANLSRLGIFNVDPDKGTRPTLTVLESDNEYKDVLVSVQETPTGSLMFGAGINSNAGLVGSIVLNEKNFDLFRPPASLADIWEGRAFRGAGQELRLEAVPGTVLQRYSATFREPFLFDRPYSLTTSGYYYNRIYNEYTETREGGTISIGHMLTRNISISGGLRIENVNVGNVASYEPPDYTSVIGDHFVAAPNLGIAWDTRDSFMRPTEGGLVKFQAEQAFGSFNYPIFNLEASRYFTTYQRPDGSGRHVLVAYSHVGWAGSETPVYDRFFAGGFQSLRGFQFRGVGPSVNGFEVGGDFLFLNGLEYQIPVRANDNLYLVAFLDSGTVESRIGIHDYRVSTGVGLRITVPIMGPVPIAIDFGFPLNQAPGDRHQLVAFWVGLFR